MFVYFYLIAQVIVEKMRMWTAGEELSGNRFHFDIRLHPDTEYSWTRKDKKSVIKWAFTITIDKER